MKRKALIIVDVQNDFCLNGSLAVKDGSGVVRPLNKMIKYAKKYGWVIIVSRDWHPEVTPHFKKDGGKWPVHCVKNTEGAKFHPDLNLDGVVIISKGTEAVEGGYSAFEGKTESGFCLYEFLKICDVDEVYIGGLATDYCVKATVLDAIKFGFKTFLLQDTCRAVNKNLGDGEKAIEEMLKAGAIAMCAVGVKDE